MDNVSFDLHPTFERAEADTLLRFYDRLYARNRFAARRDYDRLLGLLHVLQQRDALGLKLRDQNGFYEGRITPSIRPGKITAFEAASRSPSQRVNRFPIFRAELHFRRRHVFFQMRQ